MKPSKIVKFFYLSLIKVSQALPTDVLSGNSLLDQNSVSSYLDPTSLDLDSSNLINSRQSYSSTSFQNKSVYNNNVSPYYNRRQYTAPGSEVDSYGAPVAPVLEPVSLPGDYPTGTGTGGGSVDYQYPTGGGAVDYPITSTGEGYGYGAPIAPVVTEPEPPNYYSGTGTGTGSGSGTGTGAAEEEDAPEINKSALIVMLGLAILFLWPVVVFIESDPLDSVTTARSTEIETTTMMPRILDFDSDNFGANECENSILCNVGQMVTTFGSRFIKLKK